jgi:hypothetical protein
MKQRFSWMIAAATILSVCLQQAHAAEMLKDPEGFHGIPWGASVEERPEFVLVAPGERIKGYELKSGPPALGDTQVDSVQFFTIDGKFARVTIRYRGKSVHVQVLAYLQSQFGPSDHRPDEMMGGLNQEHAWRGPESQINLTYEDMGQRGFLFIESRVLAPLFLEGIGGA